MIRLWAPTLQWCLLAKGEIDGMVLYNSEGEDLYSGILMVKEAGGVVVDFNGRHLRVWLMSRILSPATLLIKRNWYSW